MSLFTSMLTTGVLCSAIGTLVKYIDDVRDENYLQGKFITVALFLCILFTTVAMLRGGETAFFLFSITLGCLFSGKVDNYEFILLTIIVIFMSIWRVVHDVALWSPIAIVIWSSIAWFDEMCNRISDDIQNRWLKKVFHYKLLYPLAACATVAFLRCHIEMLVAVLSFDLSYSAVTITYRFIGRSHLEWRWMSILEKHKREILHSLFKYSHRIG
jgi:hypothetical protein